MMAKVKTSPTRTLEMEKFSVYLPHQVMAELRQIQFDVGVPVAESIRRAVEDYLKRRKKVD
jgi:hypothetical protein